MNLDVAHEVDLAPFIHNHQDSERVRENGAYRVPTRQEHHFHGRTPGASRVGSLVEYEGVFDAPFTNLEPPGGNVEVSVNLVVGSKEARPQSLERGANVRRVAETRFEFKIEKFHKFQVRLLSHCCRVMKTELRARWSVTPREAARLQQIWRERVEAQDRYGPLRYVAGADMAFDPETQMAFAGVIVYRFPELEEAERRMARGTLRFPYVPGLLSFREGPVLLAAFRRLRISPDVILIDGHGVAHPRRFGIACHMGLLLDRPTIGCAKSILVGEVSDPGLRAGSTAPLMDKGEMVGVALRMRDQVRPIYVTIGHRVSLESAVRIVSQCADGFRLPKPTREADQWVRDLRRAYQAQRRRENT